MEKDFSKGVGMFYKRRKVKLSSFMNFVAPHEGHSKLYPKNQPFTKHYCTNTRRKYSLYFLSLLI